MIEKAFISFRTHAVLITKTDTHIHCFKVTKSQEPRCDYQVFDSQLEATEWLVQPFSLDRYEVIVI